MGVATRPATPVIEAEAARQVVGVLRRLEQRLDAGHWARGARFGADGTCLIGGIDETCAWTIPGVEGQVARELVARLPAPLRALGQLRPRVALASYNDLVGGRSGALALVRRTREELGGKPPTATPTSAQPAAA